MNGFVKSTSNCNLEILILLATSNGFIALFDMNK